MRSPEEIQARIDKAHAQPRLQALGLRIVSHDLEEGWLEAELTPSEDQLNLGGGLHGGIMALVSDVVAGMGVILSIGPEDWTTTLDLNISYLRRMKKPPIRIRGEGLHRGLRTHVWSVRFTDSAGRCMAQARATFLVQRGGRV